MSFPSASDRFATSTAALTIATPPEDAAGDPRHSEGVLRAHRDDLRDVGACGLENLAHEASPHALDLVRAGLLPPPKTEDSMGSTAIILTAGDFSKEERRGPYQRA